MSKVAMSDDEIKELGGLTQEGPLPATTMFRLWGGALRLMEERDRALAKLNFPDHKAAMSLEHNPHKNNYQSVETWIEECCDFAEWENEEEKQKSINTNEIWMLQWYPETPIGFYCVAASTLDAVIAFAHKLPKEKKDG